MPQIYERFDPAPLEWAVDGVVHDGEVVFSSLAQYGRPCLTTVEKGGDVDLFRLDPEHDAAAFAAADPVVRDALLALRHRDGVFHMELFHDPATGRTAFSECAARRGGGMVHEQVEHKFGIDLGAATAQVALGDPPDLPSAVRPGVVGVAHVGAAAGTLVQMPSPGEARDLPGVAFVRHMVPWGSELAGETVSTSDRLVEALVEAPSLPRWHDRAARVRAWYSARVLVAPAGATGREVRAALELQLPGSGALDECYEP
ncbi:MAG: hypothetical protein L0H93_20880 [Nocardioides sp.]|nr:hypothetical protein [Nocardioides sp.]